MKLRIASLLVTVSLLATAAFAQNPATQGRASGRYGLSAWAINNQRVASLFNYDIDSAFGSGLANFTFPQMTCQQALAFCGVSDPCLIHAASPKCGVSLQYSISIRIHVLCSFSYSCCRQMIGG